MTLSQIINSAETINSDAAPSLNAAFTELHALFGFWPVVLAPDGGARTKAQQAHLVAIGKSDTMNSDHREDFPTRAAADIDNHRRFRDINEPLFEATLEKHGWFNMTNDGEPFTREEWHFAKHGIVPAGSGGTPINDTEKDETMYFKRSSTKVIALFNATGEHDFASLDDYNTHRSVLNTYNAQAVNASDQQFVPPADASQIVALDETGWASVVAKYTAPASGGGGTTPAGPTKEDIAAEVIRQMKLPGN
jgi:hypothetical protein